jgi:SAM-dependent methyltransferase
MSISLWRTLLYKELTNVQLDGSILDIGGARRSGYHELIKGEHSIQVNNLDEAEDNDLSFDLEKPFPVEDELFDSVLCINVLEHIFNYQNVLNESHRILKKDGTLIVAVPFLIMVHPSPNDYWRYTEQTLEKICKNAGFKTVEIKPIGTGVFGAGYSLRHNLYRTIIVQKPLMLLSKIMDRLLSLIKAESVFSAKFYPLGYVVVAKK